MKISNKKSWSRTAFVAAAGMGLMVGCSGVAEEETVDLERAQSSLYTYADSTTIAKTFRPRFHFAGSHNCWPLTFKEIASTASASERDALKTRCNPSYSSDFIVFASVRRPTGGYASHWSNESFRVTYGVAFGWQENHLNSTEEWLVDLFANGDMGSHGEDAQYVTADVVNGSLTSVWADLHKGSYTRTKSQLTMYNDNRVTAWAGKYYNSLKLVTDKNTACGEYNNLPTELQAACSFECGFGSTCGVGDPAMNFGDTVGDTYQADGRLVMVEDVCATTGTTYTSPDNVIYSGTQLEALKAYIGCNGATTPGAWTGYFMSKTQYSDPYSLKGCKSGDTAGGDICRGSAFGPNDTWTTWSGSNRYIEPALVGNADIDYTAGSPFHDMVTQFNRPSSITIRTGSRIDAVGVTYLNGAVTSHGGSGGSAQTISGLDTDPVVSVYMCEGSKDGRERAGHIKLTTRSGRTLSGGSSSSNCKTIAPANMQLYGFYGRSGSAIDVLGTYWGHRPEQLYTVTARHSGKLMDVEGNNSIDGAQVHQWSAAGVNNQKFTFTSAGEGYFHITARHSGKCVEVSGGTSATQNNAPIVQFTCNYNDNQKFLLVSHGDGYYSIKAKHSGKCLAVAASGTANGDNFIQWECLNIDDQKFKLTAISN